MDHKVETGDRKMLDFVEKSPEDLHQREHRMVRNMIWFETLIDQPGTGGGEQRRDRHRILKKWKARIRKSTNESGMERWFISIWVGETTISGKATRVEDVEPGTQAERDEIGRPGKRHEMKQRNNGRIPEDGIAKS
jgi:hypothetical protein